jgi:hypothetical protein
MVRFEPPGLEGELKMALTLLEKVTELRAEDLSDELVDPNNQDLTADDIPDFTISEDTIVPVSLPQCNEIWSITYRQLITWLSELEGAELIDNVECWTNRRCIIRVESRSGGLLQLIRQLDQHHASDNGAAISFSVTVEDRKLECAVRAGLTLFGFLVVAYGSYEDFLPPVTEGELFIEIIYSPGTTREVIRNIASALLFEISASIDLELQPTPRPEIWVDDEENGGDGDNESESPLPLSRLRPLILGKGLPELLAHYNRAAAVTDPGLQIVMYTKVIEFVAQTVIRSNTTELIRKKLLTPRGLDPDAAFVQELQESFEALRVYRQDREAIRAAIEVACDVDSLVDAAPPFLRDLRKLRPESSEEARLKALNSFAVSIVDTRNSIVHAKPNYRPTGYECPETQLSSFSVLVKRAAQQAVRWFHGRPEHQRIC